MDKNIHTYISCDCDYENADIVLFGAPFDGTTSYRPGARFASKAIRAESFGLETYSPYQDKDLTDIKVFDGGDLELPFGNTNAALAQIEKYCEKVIQDGRTPFMIGGEHLVTLSGVSAAIKKFHDISIIHFDAHTDLRDSYLGQQLSHATVIRRCHDIVGDGRIFQFGIRSGEREEFLWGEKHLFTNKFTFDGLDNIIKQLADKPVYLTIDLDVLDPAEMPAVGTPEAGGVSFNQLLNACILCKNLNIVGVDVCELCPVYDNSGASTALAGKLIRELLLML
ncbi:MAG: agmatinase [Clostridiaceae bacterium]|nr:agmatinase [Clostridiaceae bacterium]